MTIDYFIPAIGQQELLDRCVHELVSGATGFTRVHIIDNGSERPLLKHDGGGCKQCFFNSSIHRLENNLGMIESLAYAMENCMADILVYSHSDFFIHEQGWDDKLRRFFLDDPKLGLIGAVGARVAAANGGREEVFCSFRNGHEHGMQTPAGLHPAAILDGCFMAFRRRDLDRIGIDRTFSPHHFYDKDWSLTFTLAGARVGVMDLDCEHLGGQTSCRPQYQEWAYKNAVNGDQSFYDRNEAKYIGKHKDVFPVRVNADWSVETKWKG